MPKRKNYEVQLESISAEIERTQTKLDKLLQEKKAIEDEKRKSEMQTLFAAMENANLGIEDVLAIITQQTHAA